MVRRGCLKWRYGVHNIELLDKYFYHNPCASAWIVWESDTPAEEYAVHLLEQEARSSDGLSYWGIFNHHIAFCDGHWVPLNRQPGTETVIQDCQVVNEKAPASCFGRQIAAQADGIASSSSLHVKRHAYSNTAGHAHQQQLQDLVMKQGDGGDKHCQMFISKGKHIKNVYEPNSGQLLLVVIKKNHSSTKDVSKWWVVHPMLPLGF